MIESRLIDLGSVMHVLPIFRWLNIVLWGTRIQRKTMRTRIKICGITRIEDAKTAVDAGADAIGLVFYAKSPRYVTVEQARLICQCVPAFVQCVGLFVNQDAALVQSIYQQAGLSLVQYHGQESATWCDLVGLPYIKAIRVKDALSAKQGLADYPNAKAILMDTYVDGVAGGTGEVFDWTCLPKQSERAVILAGGLDAGNVHRAIQLVNPYAVDVSSGVEDAPGQKAHDKIREFIKGVSDVDNKR